MKNKVIQIGKVKIGGGNPIAIQSMCNTKTQDVKSTVKQIRSLATAGCEIVRIAIPNMEAAQAVKAIRKQTTGIPLVADIHFDHRLALQAVENGIDKIRINPGNLGSEAKLREVVFACKKNKIPIRVGVNAGSLEKGIGGKTLAEKLANSAIANVKKVEKFGWNQIVISAKASDIKTSVEAYRILAKKIAYPLHLGITEAGSEKLGIMKSAIGIGSLLLDGIGNTIRISLTAQPEVEVKTARDLLRALGLRKDGIEVISCPTCGRTEVDLISLVAKVEKAVEGIKKNLSVAVMGCMVNGPGEAAHADFALVGGKRMFALYAKGKLIKTIPEKEALPELLKLVA